MLNRESLPVWMLADAMLGLLLSGGCLVLVAAAFMLPQLHSVRELPRLRLDVKHLAGVQEAAAEREAAWREQLAEAEDQIEKLNRHANELRAWGGEMERIVARSRERSKNEQHLRQELLNLRGDLARTMFVIDVSGSMGVRGAASDRPNWGDDNQPWTYVRNQVDSWLAHLPVQSFRLIVFNHEIEEFPVVDEGWVSGDAWRNQSREFLARRLPGGYTNTEAALKRALQWQPSSIVLFTDGAPTDSSGHLDIPQQERIQRMLTGGTNVPPINVIAVNNYFDAALGSFLHGVAARSGGGFIGL